MGSLMVDLSTPPGYTMAKTEEVMVRLTDQIQQLPEVESVGGVVGFGGANKGMVQVQLKPWAERKGNDHTSWAVSERINAILSGEREAESLLSVLLQHLVPLVSLCPSSSRGDAR